MQEWRLSRPRETRVQRELKSVYNLKNQKNNSNQPKKTHKLNQIKPTRKRLKSRQHNHKINVLLGERNTNHLH